MTESRMILMIPRLMVMTMVLTPRMFSKPNVTGLFPSLSLQSWFVFPLRIKILQMMFFMSRLGHQDHYLDLRIHLLSKSSIKPLSW